MMQAQMYCGVVIRFVICLCLAGFTAAKCVPEKCGSTEVSSPFWFKNSHCGLPGFQIFCSKDEDSGTMAPFFQAFKGENYSYQSTVYYKIMEIDYTGNLVINSTSLKAQSCSRTKAAAVESWQLPIPGPVTISMSNKFVVIGCNTIGTYRYSSWGEGKCVSICDPQDDPAYCRYGCGEITLPNNWRWFNFSGGGSTYIKHYGYVCGFSTIMDPSTFRVRDNEANLFWGEGRKADYGLRLNWGIGDQNCSIANATVCSLKAKCMDSPSRRGYVCRCLPGYEGNGYSNGTDCREIDECRANGLNKCVEEKKGGICHNLGGSYNCSCAKGYEGDGFSDGTRCTDIDECRQANRSMCVGEEEGGICHNSEGSYNCSCAKGYKGDGFPNGTRCKPEKSNKTAMSAAIGFVSAFVGVSLGACGLVWWLRTHYKKRARKQNYRCNGGVFLEQILPKPMEGKEFTIFSEDELKKASQYYSDMLGSGSSGMVYKGVLSKGTPVAIKKLREFRDGVESEESMWPFINEIVILWSLKSQKRCELAWMLPRNTISCSGIRIPRRGNSFSTAALRSFVLAESAGDCDG